MFEGIALGSGAAIVIYHAMRGIAKARGPNLEAATPASAPSGVELESQAYRRRHRKVPAEVLAVVNEGLDGTFPLDDISHMWDGTPEAHGKGTADPY